jgi:hypothetical protein
MARVQDDRDGTRKSGEVSEKPGVSERGQTHDDDIGSANALSKVRSHHCNLDRGVPQHPGEGNRSVLEVRRERGIVTVPEVNLVAGEGQFYSSGETTRPCTQDRDLGHWL